MPRISGLAGQRVQYFSTADHLARQEGSTVWRDYWHCKPFSIRNRVG